MMQNTSEKLLNDLQNSNINIVSLAIEEINRLKHLVIRQNPSSRVSIPKEIKAGLTFENVNINDLTIVSQSNVPIAFSRCTFSGTIELQVFDDCESISFAGESTGFSVKIIGKGRRVKVRKFSVQGKSSGDAMLKLRSLDFQSIDVGEYNLGIFPTDSFSADETTVRTPIILEKQEGGVFKINIRKSDFDCQLAIRERPQSGSTLEWNICDSRFAGGLSFENIHFRNNASFSSNSYWGEGLRFSGCHFYGDLSIDEELETLFLNGILATGNVKASLNKVKKVGEILISFSEFGGKKISIVGERNKVSTCNAIRSLRNGVGKIRLSGVPSNSHPEVLISGVSVETMSFQSTIKAEVEIRSCIIGSLLLNTSLNDAVFFAHDVVVGDIVEVIQGIDMAHPRTQLRGIRPTRFDGKFQGSYRTLKELFSKNGNERERDIFAAYELQARINGLGTFDRFEQLVGKLYSLLNGYGRSLWRPVFWNLAIVGAVFCGHHFLGDIRVALEPPCTIQSSLNDLHFNWALFQSLADSLGALRFALRMQCTEIHSVFSLALSFLHQIISTILWFFFLLGIRRAFKIS